MKICSRCKKEKPFDQFNKRLNGLAAYCRECNREVCRRHNAAKPKKGRNGGWGGKRKKRHPDEHFVRHFTVCPDSGCWLWTAAADKDGYGKFLGTRAHRYSYELFVGKIPTGMLVLHRCDVPNCVNPRHLWLGTGDDNMADMVAKRRSCQGDRHPRALPIDVAMAVRAEIERGTPSAAVVQKFGVSSGAVSMIRRGLTWHFREGRTSA